MSAFPCSMAGAAAEARRLVPGPAKRRPTQGRRAARAPQTVAMKLAYWSYAGPAHIGTLRIASSFKNVHAIMHAPLGDDYFNVLRAMLERDRDFTPVTASIVDRHVLARGGRRPAGPHPPHADVHVVHPAGGPPELR